MIVFAVIPAVAQVAPATEIVCNALPEGPPKGAAAIAASSLPWANEQRSRVVNGEPVRIDDAQLDAWLGVDLPFSTELQTRAQVVDDWVVAEVRAPRRPSVVPVNLVVVVDVSDSMSSIPTRALPMLQDAPANLAYRPVSRLELVREVLWDLVEHLPEESRLSMVAYAGRRARVVVPPTGDHERMGQDIDQLVEGSVSAYETHVVELLDSISTSTFEDCADNRVLVFTDDLQDLSNELLFANVARWATGDLERWTFAVGDFKPVDPDAMLLQQAPRSARWVINGASDSHTLWPALLDAGGTVAREVELIGRKKRVEVGPLVSGQSVAVRLPARKQGPVTLRIDGEEVEIPLTEAGPTSRARAEQDGIASGTAAELAAWTREGGVEAPLALAVSGWLEGDAAVVELWVDEEHPIAPEDLRVNVAGRSTRPTAWKQQGERLVVVVPVEGEPHQVAVEGAGLPDSSWVQLRRRRVGRTWIEGAHALRAGGTWSGPSGGPGDAWFSEMMSGISAEQGDDEAVLRWTESCLDLIAPDLLRACVERRATVLLERDRLSEVLALLDEALERVPGAVELALLDGDIAADHQEWTVAEERYLQVLEVAPFEARATRGLALVMQEQNLPSLAALAWARHLLFHPGDRTARAALMDLLEQPSWRTGTRGPFSEVEKLATDQRLYQMKLLFEDWSQAQARGRTLEAWREEPWYRLVGPMFSKLDRDGYVRFAAIRVLVHPDDLADHVSQGVGEVGLMLGMRR